MALSPDTVTALLMAAGSIALACLLAGVVLLLGSRPDRWAVYGIAPDGQVSVLHTFDTFDRAEVTRLMLSVNRYRSGWHYVTEPARPTHRHRKGRNR